MRTINILGFITNYSYWDDVSPRGIAKELKAANGEDVHIRINSPGGDAFAGVAIYNQLKDYEGTVNIEVIGLAASAASIIALGGDTLTVKKGAMMMIHEPVAFTIGDASRHESTAVSLRKLIDSLADVYVAGSSNDDLTAETVKKEMEAETWYTAQEAVDKGWADSIVEAESDEKDARENLKQSLTQVKSLWHNPNRIPGQVAALMAPDEPEHTEVTNNVDDKAAEKKISQLEGQVQALTNQLGAANTKLAEKNNAIASLVEKNKDLTDKGKANEAAALDAKVNAKLDAAQADGRLAKADREKWDKRLRGNFDEMADILDDMPKAVQTTATGDGAEATDANTEVDLNDPVNKVIVESMREAGYSDDAIKASLGATDDYLGEGGGDA